jgi:hypothetical protein
MPIQNVKLLCTEVREAPNLRTEYVIIRCWLVRVIAMEDND